MACWPAAALIGGSPRQEAKHHSARHACAGGRCRDPQRSDARALRRRRASGSRHAAFEGSRHRGRSGAIAATRHARPVPTGRQPRARRPSKTAQANTQNAALAAPRHACLHVHRPARQEQHPASACRRGLPRLHPPLVVEPTALGSSLPCQGPILPKLAARCRASVDRSTGNTRLPRGNTPLTVCRRGGTGVAKCMSDRDRWSTDCERPRPRREEVLDATAQRMATTGRGQAPGERICGRCGSRGDVMLRARPGTPIRGAPTLNAPTRRQPCSDCSPTCR
jgi:hypothetical protein